MKENRVLIAIPSGNMWDARFAMSMIFMSTHLAANHIINGLPTHFQVHNKKGSILPNMRQELVSQAIANHATHLLFIDSDQVFPADILHRLMAHKKSVVACNIAVKMFPSNCTARRKGGDDLIPVHTREDSTGLEEVDFIGTGVMLLDLKVFKRKAMRPAPWFTMEWSELRQHYTGEDWFLCKCLKEAGVPIYIDHDASKEIGHVGQLEYTIDMVPPEETRDVLSGCN